MYFRIGLHIEIQNTTHSLELKQISLTLSPSSIFLSFAVRVSALSIITSLPPSLLFFTYLLQTEPHNSRSLTSVVQHPPQPGLHSSPANLNPCLLLLYHLLSSVFFIFTSLFPLSPPLGHDLFDSVQMPPVSGTTSIMSRAAARVTIGRYVNK